MPLTIIKKEKPEQSLQTMSQLKTDQNLEVKQHAASPQERRLHARYGKVNLALSAARPGIRGILRINPSSSKCLDISLSGLRFNSNQKFTRNERLVLDVCVHEIELLELNAIVVDSQLQTEGYWSTRAKFCFEAKRMKQPGVISNLLKIIDRLRSEHEFPLTTPQ